MQKMISVTLLGLVAALSVGCAAQSRQQVYGDPGYHQAQSDVRGTVEGIERVAGDQQATGLGAIGGAVVGGLLGNQVGGGTGKTVATVVGAAAGAYGGHQAEKHYAGSKESYRITVRARDGRRLTYQQQDLNGLRVGDHVRAGPNGVFRD